MCRLIKIFAKQKLLMEKYHVIEAENGILDAGVCPVSINSVSGQRRLKDFAWRITEELGEAITALETGNLGDFREELVDALHFATELLILSGMSAQQLIEGTIPSPAPVGLSPAYDGLYQIYVYLGRDIPEIKECLKTDSNLYIAGVDSQAFNTIYQLTKAMYHLRNNPWKKTHKDTDPLAYYTSLASFFLSLISLMIEAGMDADMVYKGYMDKSSINQQRQNSEY